MNERRMMIADGLLLYEVSVKAEDEDEVSVRCGQRKNNVTMAAKKGQAGGRVFVE